MKQIFALMAFLLSAISAEAQDNMAQYAMNAELPARRVIEKPKFADNWSFSFAGGVYHPMVFDLKYLVDCSGFAGVVELRKQISPVVGLALEADGYYRMPRKERRDPRTVIGPMLHVNLMNLFGGYKGKPRIFEIEAGIMPAWGHLYRGSKYDIIPDEDYFATKYGLDFNFNVGPSRAWTLSLRPAAVFDVTSKSPIPGVMTYPYDGYDMRRMDLQMFVGFTYHFPNRGTQRHFNFSTPQVDNDEVERLSQIVTWLRNDVNEREAKIRELQKENAALREAQK